jgi:uncharacterized protein (DUF1499 family)
MKLHRAVLAASALAAALLLLAGPGTRLGLWQFPTGFSVLQWGAYLGLASAALAIILLLVRRPFGRDARVLLLAIGLSALAAGVPYYWLQIARRVPPIHDVTTDTENPPAFVAVLPLRADAPNSSVYGGAEVAVQQQKAFPDIQPLELPVAPPIALSHAVEAARRMGWAIVAVDSVAGRLEATATTGWFGFKDDVVVRVQPAATGSRIDVRSESRVGGSDVGTNARRIRAYLRALAG